MYNYEIIDKMNGFFDHSVFHDRTKTYVDVLVRWNHRPTEKDIKMFRYKLTDSPYGTKEFNIIECDGGFFMVTKNPDVHLTNNEMCTIIRTAYRPYDTLRDESVYINSSNMGMVDLESFYHSLISEFKNEGVKLIQLRAKYNLFSRAYLDALLWTSNGGRNGWFLPTTETITKILDVLKNRNPHVEGMFDI